MSNLTDVLSAIQNSVQSLNKIQQTLNSGLPGLVTNGIALTNLAQIASDTLLGNNTGGAGNVTALTVSQAQTLLSMRWTLTVVTATNAAFPITAGTSELLIEGWSGGGSGAGGDTGTNQRGSGGASGGYFIKHYTGAMDATLNITIGAGGAAVTSGAGGTNGNQGGTTSVVGANLGTLSAAGGGGGVKGAAGGGVGSQPTGGDENIQGADGALAPITTAAGVAAGGNAPRGGPGGASNVGSVGIVPGGGGACGNHTGGANSGAGARGEVWVWMR